MRNLIYQSSYDTDQISADHVVAAFGRQVERRALFRVTCPWVDIHVDGEEEENWLDVVLDDGGVQEVLAFWVLRKWRFEDVKKYVYKRDAN